MTSEGKFIPEEIMRQAEQDLGASQLDTRSKPAKEVVELNNKSEAELTQFWLAFFKNRGWQDGDEAKELKRAAALAKRSLQEQSDGINDARFFVIKDGNDIVATGRLETRVVKDEKHAELSLLTVDPNKRNDNYGTEMTVARVAAAKQDGCVYADAAVRPTDVGGLAIKLKDGYRVVGFKFNSVEDKIGWFEVSKRIAGEPKENEIKREPIEKKELKLNQGKEIEKLLADKKWQGVGMMNLDETKRADPASWVLMLEKYEE